MGLEDEVAFLLSINYVSGKIQEGSSYCNVQKFGVVEREMSIWNIPDRNTVMYISATGW